LVRTLISCIKNENSNFSSGYLNIIFMLIMIIFLIFGILVYVAKMSINIIYKLYTYKCRIYEYKLGIKKKEIIGCSMLHY
jgi:hypothetical protein